MEPSIEEKAKRYDEAFKRAKDLYDFYSGNPAQAQKFIDIFPELKECEDELIREELILLFQDCIDNINHPYNASDSRRWIAWLEKQAEHANFRNKIQIGDKVTRNKDGVLVNLSQLNRIAKKDEKQGEQQHFNDNFPSFDEAQGTIIVEKHGENKPADKVEPKFRVKYAGGEYNVFEIKDITGVTFYGIEDEPNHIDYVKAENCEIIGSYGIKKNGSSFPTKSIMFSEWSEEDEIEVAILEAYICSGDWSDRHIDRALGIIDELVKKYKSLKDSQPKQEWSEEDSEHLDSIIGSYKYLIADYKASHDVDYIPYDSNTVVRTVTNDVNFLQSLKDRYTWNPSDEQMEALEHFVSSIGESGYASPYDNNTKLLYSLLSDLKKQKE